MENGMQSKFTVTWIIKNFFCKCTKEIEKITSPIFFLDTCNKSEWYITLYPTYDHIVCYLYQKKNRDLQGDEIHNDFELEIIDKRGSIRFSKQFQDSEMIYGTHENFVGISTTLKMDELMRDIEHTSLTVKWHILSNDYSKMPNRECKIKTSFALERHSFEWKIKFEELIQEKNIQFQNEKYEVALNTCKNDFVITIQRNSESVFSFLGCTFSLLDSKGTQKATKRAILKLKERTKVMKFPSFLSKDTLKERECIENGIFILKCKFFVSNGSCSSYIGYKYTKKMDLYSVVPPPSFKTRDDLQRMYGDKIFSDVTFRIGNEMLSAHKCILCVNSPVFLAMFSQDMTERQTGVVDILDSDVKTFDAFLKYFYRGTIADMDYEVAVKLIKLADKYEVQPLVAMCAPILASNLSEETAFEILITADAVQNGDLKTRAIIFIKERISDILNSDQWKEFIKSNIDLMTEIILYKN